jgi:hypothetical protein
VGTIPAPGPPQGTRADAEILVRVANEQFPKIVWEHSYAIETPDGLRTMCVYGAPDEQYVRDHAAAAGLPCNNVFEIAETVGPADFK